MGEIFGGLSRKALGIIYIDGHIINYF